MTKESDALVQQILRFIDFSKQSAGTAGRLPSDLDDEFGKTALQLFRFQYENNPSYRKYCQARRRLPGTIRDWREIPPLPIQAFKELTLSCEPAEEAEAVFMTSGTTNAEKRGRHYHPTLKVWDASMVSAFKPFVLPDCERMTIFALSPARDLNPHSSLSRYVSMAVEHFGTSDSQCFFRQEGGLDMPGLARELQSAVQRNMPVLLLGASFSYVHFLDYCQESQLRFALPEASRILDTGGFKGQSREVSAQELYDAFNEYFGVDGSHCVNMYGMTELSSQLYDRTIHDLATDGHVVPDKAGPPWIRTQVLDPDTLAPVLPGTVGVFAHYDLANWNSCCAVLTEDLGVQTSEGLILHGRIQGSEARGCSIAVDQLIQANRK